MATGQLSLRQLEQSGAVNSNPSTGNYYVVEFNSAVSQITTSKRTALVELIIHYGQEVIDIPTATRRS